MKVSVQITLEGATDKSIGFSEESYDGEVNEGCLERLVQTIIYAIPKQHFASFDVIEIYKDGKVIAHGENP